MTALASVLAEVAIPTDTSGRYVAAAYLVFFVLVVVYVAIMAQRLRKVERQADDILARLDARDAGSGSAAAAEAAIGSGGKSAAGLVDASTGALGAPSAPQPPANEPTGVSK